MSSINMYCISLTTVSCQSFSIILDINNESNVEKAYKYVVDDFGKILFFIKSSLFKNLWHTQK